MSRSRLTVRGVVLGGQGFGQRLDQAGPSVWQNWPSQRDLVVVAWRMNSDEVPHQRARDQAVTPAAAARQTATASLARRADDGIEQLRGQREIADEHQLLDAGRAPTRARPPTHRAASRSSADRAAAADRARGSPRRSTVESHARMRSGGSSLIRSTSIAWARASTAPPYSSETYSASEYVVSRSVELFQTLRTAGPCRTSPAACAAAAARMFCCRSVGDQGLERRAPAGRWRRVLDDVVDQELASPSRR